MGQQYRHGDLLIEQIDEIEGDVMVKEDKILADGEATGHAHRINDGTVYQDSAGNVFFESNGNAAVTHEEHKKIAFPSGKYRVIRQQEYVPKAAPRRVLD